MIVLCSEFLQFNTNLLFELILLSYFSVLNTDILINNSYLCNQLGNALFCVTSGIFAGRAQRDPAKSHELHKIAFPNVLHTRFFLILTKKKFLQTLNEVMNFINNKLLLC
jgi:hypothetical protein